MVPLHIDTHNPGEVATKRLVGLLCVLSGVLFLVYVPENIDAVDHDTKVVFVPCLNMVIHVNQPS